MLLALNPLAPRPDRTRPRLRSWLPILALAVIAACTKPHPPQLSALLDAMSPAELSHSSLIQPSPEILIRRVNLQGQIRSALAPAPGQPLTIRHPGISSPAAIRFALGILPQFWDRHPGPVRFKIVGNGKTLWEKVLDPARDQAQRGWQEVAVSNPDWKDGPAVLSNDAPDFGALVTEPSLVSGPRPAAIMILVDALRPDRLGAYGYPRPTSPNLDALAASGLRFDNAVTASVFTLTSIASIFTGIYPWEHGVIFTRNLHLPPSLPVLAEKFQKAGYSTAAFSGTYFRFSLEGFDRGFDVFDESCAQEFFRNSADCLNRSVLPWLKAHAGEPFFLYLHYVDPHAPYYPPEPFRSRFTSGNSPDHDPAGLGDSARFGDGRKWYQVPLRPTPRDLVYLQDLYAGEVAYVDDKIGELLAGLREAGIMDSTFILATADHGEAFLEHGELEHRKVLYDEALKVPLFLSGPGLPIGRVIADQVRTLDFGATLLDLVRFQDVRLGGGKSLRLLWEGADWRPEPALAAVYLGKKDWGVALRTPDWKLIARYPGPRFELFRLADDPAEKSDLGAGQPLELQKLVTELHALCPEAD